MRSLDVAVLLLLPVAALADGDFRPFDPSKYSQAVTDCDRLAAHPDDPYHVAPGIEVGPVGRTGPPRWPRARRRSRRTRTTHG